MFGILGCKFIIKIMWHEILLILLMRSSDTDNETVTFLKFIWKGYINTADIYYLPNSAKLSE